MPRTHLLPGYALDSACWAGLDLPSDRFRAADFIAPRAGETLPEYAARLADAIGFRPGDAIAGHSLGGMIALEIARQRGASKVLLLGSCTHPRFLHPRVRFLSRIAFLFPLPLLRLFFDHFTWFTRRKGAYPDGVEGVVLMMMRRHPVEWLRRFPGMVARWKGCEPGEPCAALHCDRDWVVAPPLHLKNLTLLPGRSHLLPLARPEATRRFILMESRGE